MTSLYNSDIIYKWSKWTFCTMKKLIASLTLLAMIIIKTNASTTTTALVFTGQGYITQGQTYAYSSDVNCTVNAYAFNTTEQDDLMFSFQTPNMTHWWYVGFTKAGERLHTGIYNGATRWHTGDYTNPTFDIFGDGRGSNEVSGWFNILGIEMNPERTQIISFAADFMHYSEGIVSRWTSGSLRYNSSIPLSSVPEPGPVLLSALSLSFWLRRQRKK